MRVLLSKSLIILLCALLSIAAATTNTASISIAQRRCRAPSHARCNADNCARAATGTFRGLQSERLASCSSFQRCTVTPAATTVFATMTTGATTTTTTTTTVTVTQPDVLFTTTLTTVTSVQVVESTVTVNVKRKKRGDDDDGATTPVTNCPTALPSSVSLCSGSSRYASACSCAGITRSYTTAEVPTVTVTSGSGGSSTTVVISTVTATLPPATTRTVGATAYTNVTSVAVSTVGPSPTSGFALTLQGAHPYDGQYLHLFLRGRGDPGPLPVAAGVQQDYETGTFALDGEKLLRNYGFVDAVDGRPGSTLFRFIQPPSPPGAPYPAGYSSPACQILDLGAGNKSLYCYIGDQTAFYICPPGQLGAGLPTLPLLQLGNGANVDGCFFTTVKVVPSSI